MPSGWRTQCAPGQRGSTQAGQASGLSCLMRNNLGDPSRTDQRRGVSRNAAPTALPLVMQESNLRSTVAGEMFAAASRSATHAAFAVLHKSEQLHGMRIVSLAG